MALDAVEHVVVTFALCAHLHAERAEAVVGLKPGRNDDAVASGDGRQQRGLPACVSRVHQGAGAHGSAVEVGAGGEEAAQLLIDHGAVEQAQAHAAVCFGDAHAQQTGALHLRPQLGGDADGVVFHLAHQGDVAVVAAQVAGHVAEHVLLVGKLQIHVWPLSMFVMGSSGGGRRVRITSPGLPAQGCQAVPLRLQGLSESSPGMATRALPTVRGWPSTLMLSSRSAQ